MHQFECCEDTEGQILDAGLVFEYCIKYLKTHLHHEFNRESRKVDYIDIGFVVTVPDVWENKGKRFMRKAAVKSC